MLKKRRRVLRVTKNRVPVLLDPEDYALMKYRWNVHPFGYVYRRHVVIGADGTRTRPTIWLHKEVAKRMMGTSQTPRQVRFKNKAMLDCRRKNLRILN